MGRAFFIFLLLLCYSATPVFALSQSHVITVTATVLPSPEWTSLLRQHSTINHLTIPYFHFNIFQLLLTDGNILIRNQPINLLINNQIVQSDFTDPSGNVTFLIPKSIPAESINFSYLAINLL
jgi:hypothetical protein